MQLYRRIMAWVSWRWGWKFHRGQTLHWAYVYGLAARECDEPRTAPYWRAELNEAWFLGWDEVARDKEREARGGY